MLGTISELFYSLCCCFGRTPKSKTGAIINQIEDLGFEEYNELVKYLKLHNKSICCG